MDVEAGALQEQCVVICNESTSNSTSSKFKMSVAHLYLKNASFYNPSRRKSSLCSNISSNGSDNGSENNPSDGDTCANPGGAAVQGGKFETDNESKAEVIHWNEPTGSNR